MRARSCRPPCRPLPPPPPSTVTGPARSAGGWSTRWLRRRRRAATAAAERERGAEEEERTCMRAPHTHTHTHARALPLPLRALPLGRAKVLSDQSKPPRVKEVLRACASSASHPNEARKPFVRKEWGFNLSLGRGGACGSKTVSTVKVRASNANTHTDEECAEVFENSVNKQGSSRRWRRHGWLVVIDSVTWTQ